MTLRAFIDASHNEDIEVVAGLLFTPNNWRTFDEEWREILRDFGLDAFHTTDYWRRTRPYSRMTDTDYAKLRERICATLRRSRAIAFGSIVWKNEYEKWRLAQPSFQTADAHYFGIDRAMRFLILGVNLHPVDEGVEIVCDTDNEHERISRDIQQWHESRLRQVPRRQPGHPDPQRPINFSFGVSREMPGLQAADVISNSAFRWGKSEFAGSYQEPDFISGIKNDCPLAINSFNSAERIAIEVQYYNRHQIEAPE